MQIHFKSLLNTASLILTFLLTSHAHAGSITNTGDFGGNWSSNNGTSQDGLIAAGSSIDGSSNSRAYYWTSSGGMLDIGTLGGSTSSAYGLSKDGTTVIGYSDNGVDTEAFYWTQGTGMIGLGMLGAGSYSGAYDVNNDGSVIVGEAHDGTNWIAFRWTQGGGMQSLGFLAGGGNESYAQAVSGDGLVVGGFAENATGDYEGFRWTQGTGMVGLGTLGGNGSSVFAMNHDGSVIIGQADNGIGETQAFRWTQGTGMVGLNIAGSTFSYAQAVNNDGSLIVGNSDVGGFMWSSTNGARLLSDVITDSGVDITGWSISGASFISDDGTIIAGTADLNGDTRGYILNLTSGGNSGIITPEELGTSLLPTIVPAQQSYTLVSNGIGQSLMVARNALNTYFPSVILSGTTIDVSNPASIAPAAGGETIFNPYGHKRTAFYTTGNMGFGQNNDMGNRSVNGTAGALVELDKKFVVGGGLIIGHSTEATHLNGESNVNATGVSINTTYESDIGLRLYGTVAVSRLNVDSNRNYMNGATLDSSSGETDGFAYGTAIRLGYEFADDITNLNLMPYAELQYSRSRLDAYTETGGAFPAIISKQTGKNLVSLLGIEASKVVTPDLTLRGRGAWGHRYTDDNTVTVTAATITQTLTGDSGDKNWAELGFTVNYKISGQTTFTADIQGRSNHTSAPLVNVGVGLVWNF